MSKSKKPRKAYRPKHSYAEQAEAPMRALCSRSAELIEESSAREIKNQLNKAFIALREGVANDEHMNALITAGNISTVLAEKGVGAWCLPSCSAALKELGRIKRRFESIGRFVATGDGLKSISAMIDARHSQLTADGYTAGLEWQAAEIVTDRRKAGHFLRVEDLEAA